MRTTTFGFSEIRILYSRTRLSLSFGYFTVNKYEIFYIVPLSYICESK